MTANDNPELDDVLNALTIITDKTEEPPKLPTDLELDDESIFERLLTNLEEGLKTNNEMLEQSKDLFQQIGQAEYAEAYSSIAKANAEIYKNITTIYLEKQKLKQANALKTRDLDLKEKALSGKVADKDNPSIAGGVHQTNILLNGTPDDIFNLLFSNQKDREKTIEKLTNAIDV